MPRINNAAGDFTAKFNIDDKTFVQFMLAYRLYMPNIGMNVSTREEANFRDNLIDIAATKFSAGSKTDVADILMLINQRRSLKFLMNEA